MHLRMLSDQDPKIAQLLEQELRRQQNQLELIASENFTSLAVLEAQGSILTNKYAEGYPGHRYYGGCEYVDRVETLAVERACQVYECAFANVQPHSGSQANQEAFFAFLKPGDTFLGMSLISGGHLTHGAPVNLSGKWFHGVKYGVRPEDGRIDMEEVARQARTHRPKLIIAGGSAYPRQIDFAAFRRIADEVGAYLMVDMAHFAGLVAGKVFPSPLPHAHLVTSTTHKTLRGPRGGLILAQTSQEGQKLNSAVFPGIQGGPLMHVIAAKAVAFQEALDPGFHKYAHQVIRNAQALGRVLAASGFNLVTGGTDSHLLLIDLRSWHLEGQEASHALERAGITCNKNSIPGDLLPPTKTSGIRLGTPACTTRGFKEEHFEQVGEYITQVLKALSQGTSSSVEQDVRCQVARLCHDFPLYPDLSPAGPVAQRP